MKLRTAQDDVRAKITLDVLEEQHAGTVFARGVDDETTRRDLAAGLYG